MGEGLIEHEMVLGSFSGDPGFEEGTGLVPA